MSDSIFGSFNTVKGLTEENKITFERVESAIHTFQETVYYRYIGSFSMKGPNFAPYRKDNKPSFSIFRDEQSGKLLWKDHSTEIAGRTSGNIFHLVSMLRHCSIYDALCIINDDFNLGFVHRRNLPKSSYDFTKVKRDKHTSSRVVTIDIVPRPFNKKEIEFWEELGVDYRLLNSKYNVYSIEKYRVKDNLGSPPVITYLDLESISFAYGFREKENYYYKIYRPYSLPKWINNIPAKYVLGHAALTKNTSLLILTKSYKDAICISCMGYNAVACVNETSIIDPQIISYYKKYYNKIAVFFDNDKAGIQAAEKYKTLYNIPSIRMYSKDSLFDPELPKDISDFTKTYGVDEGKKMMGSIISQLF